MKANLSLITLALATASLALGASEIADAAARHDIDTVRSLIASGADVNAPQADDSTALLWAVHFNEVEAAKLLLDAGADPAASNRFGATPLSEAAALGSRELVQLLLEHGADPNVAATADGETALMIAARAGDADTVQLLIERGADINIQETYKGQTALMWAAAEGHAPVVELLLANGADWQILSYSHETKMPKLSAASSVSPMARGGMAAFHFAAREGDRASVETMLLAGVDINQLDIDATPALTVALMNKHYSLAKYLLEQGADPNLADVNGRTALYAAVDMRNEDYSALPGRPALDPMPSIEIIQAVLDQGADPNAALTQRLPGRSGMDSGDTSLSEGSTPLMRAARAGDTEAIRLLLAYGADPTLETDQGNNAMMFAAGIGYRDKNTSGTERGALESLQVLLDEGLDINQPNTRGETPLHGAASRGADSIVQYLVDHGARTDIKSKPGWTPLDVAMGKGSFGLPVPRPSTVALLRELGAPEGTELPDAEPEPAVP